MGKIGITELILRDAHQSVFATRMRTEDMEPILSKMDKVGFWAVEMWGGATFDVPLRYLNQNPWDRLRLIRKLMPNTKLMMLLRAQNIVAYRNFPDDIVRKFVHYAHKNGIDVFRVFDALNDLRNMDVPMKAVKTEGAHLQACVSYTISPVHTTEYYIKFMQELDKRGSDSICIKDMAGMISPKRAYDIIKGYKDRGGKCPVELHSHSTSGMTGLAYQRAAEAGVDVVDTDISPVAEGTGHPATESVVYAFKDTEWDTGLDMDLLLEMREYFKKIVKKYRHLIRMEALRPDPSIVLHQIPGGMISNLVSQLEQQRAADRLDEVLHEIQKVREEMGYPPLVTPTSQVVGVQAVMNVLFGRYKKIPTETVDYVKGMYGRSPAPISDEIKEMILGPDWKEQVITCRPADLLEPEWDIREKELKEMGLYREPEDVLIYAIYPQIGLKFLKGEARAEFNSESLPLPIDHPMTRAFVKSFFPEHKEIYLSEKDPALMVREALDSAPAKQARPEGPETFKVKVGENEYDVTVYPPGIGPGMEVTRSASLPARNAPVQGPSPARPVGPVKGEKVKSPMLGTIFKILVKEGERVKKDQTLLILEAMKMENQIISPRDGTVAKINVTIGQEVGSSDTLLIIS
ncbi:MAG: pyruvate/oxaloacetate carboxyltransferase [Candidatus Thermoplasmatota archaeon]|nr:pyruvate/oxaloacetate carboxyltransferase [Candidatus Thermoplasmatota archaeon]